jgi:hypothetical protein
MTTHSASEMEGMAEADFSLEDLERGDGMGQAASDYARNIRHLITNVIGEQDLFCIFDKIALSPW